MRVCVCVCVCVYNFVHMLVQLANRCTVQKAFTK